MWRYVKSYLFSFSVKDNSNLDLLRRIIYGDRRKDNNGKGIKEFIFTTGSEPAKCKEI